MNNKPVPEFMKRYMENIGYESYTDYDRLSQQYHKTIADYHEKVHPAKAQMAGLLNRTQGKRINFDGSAELHVIEERFKGRALETACQYGYIPPEKDNSLQDRVLTQTQEKGAFNTVLGADDLNRSPEDKRADKAHASFEIRNNITPEMKRNERDFIEQYYGKSIEPKQADLQHELKSTADTKPEPDKPMPDKYERQVKRFQLTKNDITQTGKAAKEPGKGEPQKASRYLSSLSSEQAKNMDQDINPAMKHFKDTSKDISLNME